MRKNKTFYLIIVLIFFIIMLGLIVFLKPENEEERKVEIEEKRIFRLVSTNLKEKVNPAEPVKVNFSEGFDPQAIEVDVYPRTAIKISPSENSAGIIIEPEQIWNHNSKYTLEIRKANNEQLKSTLDKNYSFNFETQQYSGI